MLLVVGFGLRRVVHLAIEGAGIPLAFKAPSISVSVNTWPTIVTVFKKAFISLATGKGKYSTPRHPIVLPFTFIQNAATAVIVSET
jgi:hypothetical protein